MRVFFLFGIKRVHYIHQKITYFIPVSNSGGSMKFVLLMHTLTLMACTQIENVPEKVDKLRAFGVSTDQTVYTPSSDGSDSGTLTFYIATPSDTPIEVFPIDLETEQMELYDVTINDPDEYSELNIFTITASFYLPAASEIPSFPLGYVALEYAMGIQQGDEDVERVRGKIKVYPAETAPTVEGVQINILSPEEGGQIRPGKTELQADITNTFDESYRVSWLVADGEIEQYRAIETTWEGYTTQTKTVIATVRGLETWNFAYTVLDVDVIEIAE